jgi:hypothetical protein
MPNNVCWRFWMLGNSRVISLLQVLSSWQHAALTKHARVPVTLVAIFLAWPQDVSFKATVKDCVIFTALRLCWLSWLVHLPSRAALRSVVILLCVSNKHDHTILCIQA